MDPLRFTTPPPKGQTPAVGVYTFGMDEESRKALNFAKGLYSYTKLKRHDDPDQKISFRASVVGRLVSDTLLFGPEAVLGHYLFWGNDYKANTKEGKAERAEAERQAGLAQVVRPKERAEAAHLIEVATANDEIVRCLNASGYCEAGIVADLHGLRFRSWVDKLLPKAVVDIKTTRAATEGEFLDGLTKYGYDGQASLYLDQCESLGLGQLAFCWLVISKTSNRAWVQELPPWAYWTGRRWVESMIRSYHREQALLQRIGDKS